MKPLKLERGVAAPAATAWAVLTDVARWPEVLSGVARVERLDGGRAFGVGTRWKETRVMFGRESTEEMEVTGLEPGRSYVVEALSRGTRYRSVLGVDAGGADAEGAAGARLYLTFHAEPEGAVGRLVGATLGLLFRAAVRKRLRQDLDDLAAAAERGG